MSTMNPHDTENGGHEPADIDPFIPTGQCAICLAVNVDDRLPEHRWPGNPYVSGFAEVPEPELRAEAESEPANAGETEPAAAPIR
ncbi:hypothetical protein MN032_04440 [Agromyces atrinae]|uniref:hypothetical protein n=1 Tax=Agromyces atrinae TaxID=592376 RepID=UPI001F565595|nr:hypothetical protein [Agromyces atrinae]MCI2956932.1 hypothetical protein [Agromyces atrinae]